MNLPGANIRLLRQSLGLTLQALASAAGMDAGNLSKLETGKSGYSAESLRRLARALCVSEDTLFASHGLVEAAAVGVRHLPVLDHEQLVRWKGADDTELSEDQERVPTALKAASRHSFALRVADGANLPKLELGDVLIFDPLRQPKHGTLVAAHNAIGSVYVGRFKPMSAPADGDPAFEVVPLDTLYQASSSLTDEGLVLRGTMIEQRKYF